MTFLAWLDKRITRWGCNRYGHQGVKTIETHQVTIRVKNWVSLGKNLVFVPPYKQFFINGKHKCTKCGVTFIGIIVKEEIFHDNLHGMP
jgi:hypothetical protein